MDKEANWNPEGKGPFTVTLSCGHVATFRTFGPAPTVGRAIQCAACSMKIRTVRALNEEER